MPPFVHPLLLWGLLIVGLPVLIHLINMLRHRRVDWAAMEFLRISQKKHRTWIILKQLLLLLLRMVTIATIVLIVAQPLLRNELGELFGSTKTHHVVLVDDSFSMSDRWTDRSAFGEAQAVIEQIGAVAARERQPQTFTLLRFSRIGQPGRGTRPDLLEEPVNSEFAGRLAETLAELEVSQTSAGPIAALEAVDRLPGGADGERRIVYLISDFRAREWDHPTDLRQQLLRLNKADAEIYLINCVEQARANLAIESLVPGEGIRAAGVPLFMEVSVRNLGTTPAREVPVLLEEDGHARPAATIDEIPPGRTVTERFQVFFPTAGEHLTVARLETDAVEADNSRNSVVGFPVDIPVLLVDGAVDPWDARFLNWALTPGGVTRTGIRPQIETPRYLTLNPLDEYRAIYLANFERLDDSAVRALEEYAAAGGGVAFFLGEQCRSKFINERLFREGEGLFPLPLAGPEHLTVDRLERAPDLQVGDHPIFKRAADERYGFIDTVNVEQYFASRKGWKPEPDSGVEVIARLRNGAPLAVERRFGEGRVVALLTTAAPTWNNWATNPSFVIAAQDMAAYLTRRPSAETGHQVGSALELKLDANEYQKQVRFAGPNEDSAATATTDAVATKDGSLAASFAETDTSGIYQARLTKTNGQVEVRCYAVNVDAGEGDLTRLSGPQLAPRLEGVQYQYRQAAAFRYTVTELAGYNVSQWLLYLLVAILIGEQILAWSASYHPPARQSAASAKGGAP